MWGTEPSRARSHSPCAQNFNGQHGRAYLFTSVCVSFRSLTVPPPRPRPTHPRPLFLRAQRQHHLRACRGPTDDDRPSHGARHHVRKVRRGARLEVRCAPTLSSSSDFSAKADSSSFAPADKAYEANQKYKEGKHILEKALFSASLRSFASRSCSHDQH